MVSQVMPKGWLIKPGWEVVELPADTWSVSEVLAATGRQKTPVYDYKDSIDKDRLSTYTSSEKSCGQYAVRGVCGGCGTSFAKELLCGREWCPVCGENWSSIHQQRFSRLLPRAQQMQGIGYFVLEFPISSRGNYHTKVALRTFGQRAKGAFKSLGYSRGLRRWHYFGDKNTRYNPHLNVIVDGAYLKPERLADIKEYLRLVLDEPQLIVNYSYRQSVFEMVHCLKYITRATFRDRSWDGVLADELHNFRNTSYWGKWKNDTVWQLGDNPGAGDTDGMDVKAVEALHSGACPCCGGKLVWTRKRDVRGKLYERMLKLRKRIEVKPPGMSLNDMLKDCRGIQLENSIADDIRDILRERDLSQADLVPMDIVKQTGVYLGAGYWQLNAGGET